MYDRLMAGCDMTTRRAARATQWLSDHVRELLGAITRRENLIESAHNTLMAEFLQALEVAQDTTKTLDEREKAGKLVHDHHHRYETRLREQMAKHDPDALPDDLETLRALYVERLEAHTMARTKYLKKAATQQGVDRGASCVDEERAVQEVAKQSVLGTLEIQAAESAADAKSAYDAAKVKIDAVEALNIPVWHVGAQSWPASGGELSHSGSTVTVDARHPAGATIDGRVTIDVFSAYYEDGRRALGTRLQRTSVPGDAKGHRAIVTLRQGETNTVIVDLYARNLCGSSKFTVKLTP